MFFTALCGPIAALAVSAPLVIRRAYAAPTVCGYSNRASVNPADAEMAAPCFITVGSEGEDAKVSLAEIKVGGYTKIEDEGDGCEAGITLTVLGASGAAKKINGHFVNYTWYDCGTDIPAGWYDDDGGAMVSAKRAEEIGFEQSYWGDAANIKFGPGEGFRATESSDYEGLTLKFPSPLQVAE